MSRHSSSLYAFRGKSIMAVGHPRLATDPVKLLESFRSVDISPALVSCRFRKQASWPADQRPAAQDQKTNPQTITG
eukprot:701072-Pleurochrysis_carterae.AAC.1